MKSQLLRHAGGFGKAVHEAAANLMLPPLCPASSERVAEPGLISPQRWARLHFIDAPYCVRCGVPFAMDYGEGIECAACIKDKPDFDRARAAVVYEDASHDLIVGFKHSDRTELAPMFANWMARAGKEILSEKAIIVPTPLHRGRLLSRRYNQSQLLAAELVRQCGLDAAPRVLERVRATPPQKELSADARRRNVAGAFRVPNGALEMVKNAHIVLIDDVLTTGATLSAAARSLKRAGAKRVEALVLSRVIKGGVGPI